MFITEQTIYCYKWFHTRSKNKGYNGISVLEGIDIMYIDK